MTHQFDKEYWENHWDTTLDDSAMPSHPALETEVAGLTPGTALDAGSGEGAEANWLAAHGWEVTAVDISRSAVTRAVRHVSPGSGSVTFTEADLTIWEPARQFELVATFYAHPAMPQHAFYERISRWVGRGGTLLIIGHHQEPNIHSHPGNAVAGVDQIRALLDPAEWAMHTAAVRTRTVMGGSGHGVTLNDVVVRAQRI